MSRLLAAWTLAALSLLGGCVTQPVVVSGEPVTATDEALWALLEDYFDEWLSFRATTATAMGFPGYDAQLELSATEAHWDSQLEMARLYLEEARAIDPAGLSRQGRLSLDLFLRDREQDLAGGIFPAWLMPFDGFDGGVPATLILYGSGEGAQPFETPGDYQRWIQRASMFPRWVDGAIAAMRRGLAEGVTPPAVVMEKSLRMLSAGMAESPEASVFYAPIRKLPRGWKPAEREQIRVAMVRLIEERLTPSYRRLHDFVRDEYLPGCREGTAWVELPDGRAWYRHLVAQHTTLPADDALPASIHATGLAEVARIRSAMETVKREVGFEGDLQQFFAWVRNEPAFYYDDPEDLLQGYRTLRRRINARLPRLFSYRPRADYVVRPIESFRAESEAGAEYAAPSADGSVPGIFYINTFNLRAQPKFGMETLSLHEASPGHHYQSSVQAEMTDLPRFRRFGDYTAYSEGWALYAESLGRELGLFREPMAWFGRLNDEMLRAMRLVVDTGLHTRGWSREQAIRYMQENSSMADSDIVAEVDRYIVWPGQALAYKLGDLHLQRLRGKYQQALGGRFDVRDFHWQVLRDGALPLDLLEEKLDRWAGLAPALP
ncbi:MAG: DUF885 domain-containing protein [Steroidobacteraceae bacterium]